MEAKYSRYYTYIKPVLKNKFVKTYSSIVFSIITITIFSLYAIRPTVSTIVSLQKSINEQQDILDKLIKKRQDLAEGRKNYQSIDDEIHDRLLNLVPDYTSLPNLMRDITSVTQINQASLSALQIEPLDLDGPPDQLNNKAAIKEIPFSMSLQGSYPLLSKVLDSFTKTNRIIDLISINFNKPADASSNVINMTLSGKSYYLKHAAEILKPGAK